jgi:hypothetical protein
VRFGAPLTGLNSPEILVLLTVPWGRPSVFLRCMSMLFHTVLVTHLLVSLVVFSSTINMFPFAPSLISLIYLPFPGSPVPLTVWAYYSIIYLFYQSEIVSYYSITYWPLVLVTGSCMGFLVFLVDLAYNIS